MTVADASGLPRSRFGGAAAVALLLALVLGAPLLSGCGQDCTQGSIECHGNAVWECTQVDSDHAGTAWSKNDCGPHRYCRIGTVPSGPLRGAEQGVCAAAPDPEPSCLAPTMDSRNNESACTPDGRAVLCMAGYVVEVLATCTSPALCIASATPAVCSVASVPDPRCPAGPTHVTTCQGDRAVTCAAGYLVSDQDCGPGLCYTPAGPQPTCVASTTPDPRCTAISGGSTTGVTRGCTGNSLFTCVDGLYTTQAQDCGIDYCRELSPGASSCRQVP